MGGFLELHFNLFSYCEEDNDKSNPDQTDLYQCPDDSCHKSK